MLSDSQAECHALPPHVQSVQMTTGAWVSNILHTAAVLELADQFTSGPRSAPNSRAAYTRMHPPCTG